MTDQSGLRDVLRNSLLGWGAMTWVSPRRQRVAKLVFPVAGFLLGLLVALFARSLPGEVWTPQATALLVGAGVVVVVSYIVLDITFGLEMQDKRAVETDIELARQIQQRALPASLPQVAGYDLAAHHQSARAVGGDAYDAFLLDNGHLLIAVADVSGKGVGAALLMMGVLARMRSLACTAMGLAELAERLNRAMVIETEVAHFSTLVMAELDPATGRIDYVNAGNPPPLLLRADGRRESLELGGIPVGMLPDMTYTAGVVRMEPGDRLLLMTDGVQDADEEGTVLLDDAALAAIAAGPPHRTAAAIVADVRDEVARRSGEHPFDDVTVLVLGRQAAG